MSDEQALPDLPEENSVNSSSDNQQQEDVLARLARQDAADRRKETASLNKTSKKQATERNVKKIALIGVGGAAVVALGAGLLFNPFTSSSPAPGNTNPGTVNNTATNNTGSNNKDTNARTSGFWDQDGKLYPVTTQGWQILSWQNQTNPNYITNYMRTVPGFNKALLNLPGNGFTDDSSKAFLADGTINPLYSYWTAAGFNKSVGFALQRFVNPNIGEWVNWQFPSGKSSVSYLTQQFQDVYDPAYFAKVKNENPSQWLPVYADWNFNNYGMGDQLLENGSRWIGTIDSVHTDWKFDDKTQSYSVKLTANVTYSAWAQDQSKLTKKGVITFDVTKGPEQQKYMISNTKLEMAK